MQLRFPGRSRAKESLASTNQAMSLALNFQIEHIQRLTESQNNHVMSKNVQSVVECARFENLEQGTLLGLSKQVV
jgi:uncharacterized membrane protein